MIIIFAHFSPPTRTGRSLPGLAGNPGPDHHSAESGGKTRFSDGFRGRRVEADCSHPIGPRSIRSNSQKKSRSIR